MASAPFVLSPDGMRLAYVANSPGGMQRLFTRRLDQAKAVELPGTEGAVGPCFSQDGQWIGFYTLDKFKKISVEGGAVIPIVDASGIHGGASWGEDGDMVLTGAGAQIIGADGLERVPSSGEAPIHLTKITGELYHVLPQVLPGGKAVLFVAYPALSADRGRIEVVTLADGRRKTVVPVGTSVRFIPTSSRWGHILYTNHGTLFAVPFDLDRLETRGMAVPVLDGLAYQQVSGLAQMDVSRSGTWFTARQPAARRLK